MFRFSEKRNFSNGNMDTFVSHAEDEEDEKEPGRQMGSEKAFEMISTKDSSFFRSFVWSFVRSLVCLLASGLCVYAHASKIWFLVFHFDFWLILFYYYYYD